MQFYMKKHDFIDYPTFNLSELSYIFSLLKFSMILVDNKESDYQELTIMMPYYNSYFSYFKSFFGYSEYITSTIYYNYEMKCHKLIFIIDMDNYDDKKIQWWKFQVNYIIECIKYYYKPPYYSY